MHACEVNVLYVCMWSVPIYTKFSNWIHVSQSRHPQPENTSRAESEAAIPCTFPLSRRHTLPYDAEDRTPKDFVICFCWTKKNETTAPRQLTRKVSELPKYRRRFWWGGYSCLPYLLVLIAFQWALHCYDFFHSAYEYILVNEENGAWSDRQQQANDVGGRGKEPLHRIKTG